MNFKLSQFFEKSVFWPHIKINVDEISSTISNKKKKTSRQSTSLRWAVSVDVTCPSLSLSWFLWWSNVTRVHTGSHGWSLISSLNKQNKDDKRQFSSIRSWSCTHWSLFPSSYLTQYQSIEYGYLSISRIFYANFLKGELRNLSLLNYWTVDAEEEGKARHLLIQLMSKGMQRVEKD